MKLDLISTQQSPQFIRIAHHNLGLTQVNRYASLPHRQLNFLNMIIMPDPRTRRTARHKEYRPAANRQTHHIVMQIPEHPSTKGVSEACDGFLDGLAAATVEGAGFCVGGLVEVRVEVDGEGAEVGFQGAHFRVVVQGVGLDCVYAAVRGEHCVHPLDVVVVVDVVYQPDILTASSIPGCQIGQIATIARRIHKSILYLIAPQRARHRIAEIGTRRHPANARPTRPRRIGRHPAIPIDGRRITGAINHIPFRRDRRKEAG